MRLSEYTDYTLRVLMCCAREPERRLTIAELAQSLQVSKNHLMKIVNDLARLGMLETTRGRGGGIRLLQAPETIRIGDVLRNSETDFRMVECFELESDTCTLTSSCRLRHVLQKALHAFMAELDSVTLAEIARPSNKSAGGVLSNIRMALPGRRSA
ncbi:MAG: Rrf2 family transcriptional regulator [Rubrivivax sp.]|nr:MAG: Rrf2 family transcriptional regulator [Rubrivivax sp.]